VKLFDLSGKVALVTGGNGGIGLGMAKGLSAAGARVAVVGRNPEKSQEAARQVGADAMAVSADVTSPDQVERAIGEVTGRFGRLDVVVNNAGIIVRKAPQDMTLDEWNSVMAANVTGAFLMAKAAYPALKRAGGGKIINIGSMASIFGSSYASSYAASKGAIVQLTRSLALAWAADNIQVRDRPGITSRFHGVCGIAR